jgi:hypothetical protein
MIPSYICSSLWLLVALKLILLFILYTSFPPQETKLCKMEDLTGQNDIQRALALVPATRNAKK